MNRHILCASLSLSLSLCAYSALLLLYAGSSSPQIAVWSSTLTASSPTIQLQIYNVYCCAKKLSLSRLLFLKISCMLHSPQNSLFFVCLCTKCCLLAHTQLCIHCYTFYLLTTDSQETRCPMTSSWANSLTDSLKFPHSVDVQIIHRGMYDSDDIRGLYGRVATCKCWLKPQITNAINTTTP